MHVASNVVKGHVMLW